MHIGWNVKRQSDIKQQEAGSPCVFFSLVSFRRNASKYSITRSLHFMCVTVLNYMSFLHSLFSFFHKFLLIIMF